MNSPTTYFTMSQVTKLSERLAQLRLLTDSWRNRTAFISLPIKKICGIPVRCVINISGSGSSHLVVYHNDVFHIDGEEDPEQVVLYAYLSDNDEKMAEHIFGTLPQLKFDKYSSRLVTETDPYSEVELFSGLCCSTIEMDFEECCVCCSNTKYKTGCGHHLCIECCGSIKRSYCSEARNGNATCACDAKECGIIRCPICRQSVEHY